jgi:hypothetical protein
MRRRFRDRVWLERAVLSSVNSRGLYGCPLAGLSRQAIEQWCARNRISTGSQLIAQIMQISRNGELLVDCSRDVFADDPEDAMIESLRIQLQSLEGELERVAQSSV